MKNTEAKPKLLHEKNLNIYGLFYYYSSYNAYKLNNSEVRQDVRHVIGFKKHGRHIEEIKKLVEYAKNKLSCEVIIALPSSSTKLNQLQEMFGADYIKRVKSVEQRKYDHKKRIDKAELKTLQINYDSMTGKKILLLDDVITTGETIRFYRDVLKDYDITVLSIGLNYRLKPEILEYIELPKAEPEGIKPDGIENHTPKTFENNITEQDITEQLAVLNPDDIYTEDVLKVCEYYGNNYDEEKADEMLESITGFLTAFHGESLKEIQKNFFNTGLDYKLSKEDMEYLKESEAERVKLEKVLNKKSIDFDFV